MKKGNTKYNEEIMQILLKHMPKEEAEDCD
jgi:hypothetical protein